MDRFEIIFLLGAVIVAVWLLSEIRARLQSIVLVLREIERGIKNSQPSN